MLRYANSIVGGGKAPNPAWVLCDEPSHGLVSYETIWLPKQPQTIALSVGAILDLVQEHDIRIEHLPAIVAETMAELAQMFANAASACHERTHDPVILYREQDEFLAILARSRSTREVELLDPKAWEELI